MLIHYDKSSVRITHRLLNCDRMLDHLQLLDTTLAGGPDAATVATEHL